MDYVITITHVGNGSVSPSGLYNVEEGDTCRIVATPAPGHAVSKVVVTGPEGSVTTPLLTEVILENVKSNFSVEFTFVPDTADCYCDTNCDWFWKYYSGIARICELWWFVICFIFAVSWMVFI